MHGLGNDFIVIEARENVDYSELAIKLCDRHFGIGADGLLVVEPSGIADIRMRILMQMVAKQKCAVMVLGVLQNMFMKEG